MNDVKSGIANLKIKDATKSDILEILSKSEMHVEYHLAYMKKRNIDILDVDSLKGDYSLKHIEDSPKYLYAIGKIPCIRKNIAVIGARNCSDYGRKMAYEISFELAKNDFVVTSGMAYGVDASAHKGAIDGGGQTIAVLGSGVDVCYPKANYNLYQKIKNHGVILSECSLGAEPTKYAFPLRNRIISGLCSAVIVVEAKEKSGTMITVKYALDQGRQIFAVPGNINSNLSNGTNSLIKEGATSYTSIKDLFDEMTWLD